MLDVFELSDLEDALKNEVNDHWAPILAKLNRTGELETLLSLLGAEHLLKQDTGYHVYNTEKIVVIGESAVKADVLLGVGKSLGIDIGKSLGIDKNRFVLYLDYEDAKKQALDKKLQWHPEYSVVLFGPTPHSGKAKGDASSVITAIESGEGYPPVVRLGKNELKITKSDFRQKLQELLETGLIA